MKNYVELLESYIKSRGWYSGQMKLTIEYIGEFEGFYGKASETWEQRAQITLDIPKTGEIKAHTIFVIGGRYDGINDVAKMVFEKLTRMDAVRK